MGVRCVWMMMVVMTATEAVVATEAHLLQHLTHKVVLDQQGNYVMLWEPLEDRIVIEVQVATRGYVILGFSTTGEMKGADIVLGWMDDLGRLFLHDRSSDGYTVPKVDESQDVELLGGYQNDTHTVLRFSRPWVTCDHNDIRLSDDTVRVIWAYGDEDPKDIITMKMHSAGGTKSVYLQVPQLRFPRLSDDVQTWELVSPNVSLPDDLTTLYWCKLYKMPAINRKVHIIGYVPVIKEENLPYIHHIQLYECHLPDSKRHFEKWLDVHGSQCFAPSTPISWYNCLSPIIAWAVGSEGEMYPDHVGLPIGEEYGGATYFMMEVHYDNPSLTPGVVDASGLRIFYTEVLRPNDAGLMVVGHDVSPKLIIPPNQSSWLTVGHCHGSCTGEVLPSGGVHVLQGLLHSHLLGSAISLRRVREGQELPAILQDMSYDFNYQQSRILKQEVTILPGDHLITECNYDSSRRRAPTFGGFGTEEEMCLAFLGYYPRSNWTHCLSAPRLRTILDGLGVEDIYNKDTFLGNVRDAQESVDEEAETEMARAMSSDGYSKRTKPLHMSYMLDKLVIKAPEKYYNKSLYSILHDDATWQDEVLVERLQDLVITGRHELKCPIRHHRTIPGVARTATYPDFLPFEPTDDQCGNNEPGSTSAAMPPAVNPVDNTISA